MNVMDPHKFLGEFKTVVCLCLLSKSTGIRGKGTHHSKSQGACGKAQLCLHSVEEAMYLQALGKDSSVHQEGEHMKAPSSPSLTKLGVGDSEAKKNS